MELKRELFAPLFRDLMHLEITLVVHPFTDRTAAPDPEAQLVDINESYRLAMPQSTLQANSGVGQLEFATAESGQAVAAGIGSVAVDLSASFSGIEKAADTGISKIETLRKQPDQAGAEELAAEFEIFPAAETGVEAGVEADEEAGADTLALQARLDEQEKTMLRIRDNSKHIVRILNEANYNPPPQPSASRPEPEFEMEIAAAEHETSDGDQSKAKTLALAETGEADQPQWTPEHIMQIRKYWEVRPTDGVLMRTVIGLDGDVVVHIDPSIAGLQFEYLHRLHDQSVGVSVGFWKELAGILSDFISNLFDSLVSR